MTLLCLGPSTANGKTEGNGREDASRKSPEDLGGSESSEVPAECAIPAGRARLLKAERQQEVQARRCAHAGWPGHLGTCLSWAEPRQRGSGELTIHDLPWALGSSFSGSPSNRANVSPMVACMTGTSDFRAPCFSGATEGQHIS